MGVTDTSHLLYVADECEYVQRAAGDVTLLVRGIRYTLTTEHVLGVYGTLVGAQAAVEARAARLGLRWKAWTSESDVRESDDIEWFTWSRPDARYRWTITLYRLDCGRGRRADVALAEVL